jgi:hypothetical protein
MRHDDRDHERRRCGRCGKMLHAYDSISVADTGERCYRCFNKELAERLGVDFDNTPRIDKLPNGEGQPAHGLRVRVGSTH